MNSDNDAALFDKILSQYKFSKTNPGDKSAWEALANSSRHLADVYFKQNKHKEIIPLYEYTFEAYSALAHLSPDDLSNQIRSGKAALNLMNGYFRIDNLTEAEKYIHQALKIANDLKEKHPTSIDRKEHWLSTYLTLGDTFFTLGKYEPARKFYEEGYGVAEENDEKDKVNSNWVNQRSAFLSGIGKVAEASGETEEAIMIHTYRYELFKERCDLQPSEIQWKKSAYSALLSLGTYCTKLSEFEQALRAFEKALPLKLDIAAASPTFEQANELMMVYDKIGKLCISTKRPKDAILFFRSELDIAKQLASKSPDYLPCKVQVGMVENLMGQAYIDNNQVEEGRQAFEASILTFLKLTKDNPADPSYRNNLMSCYYKAGEYLPDGDTFSKTACDIGIALQKEKALNAANTEFLLSHKHSR